MKTEPIGLCFHLKFILACMLHTWCSILTFCFRELEFKIYYWSQSKIGIKDTLDVTVYLIYFVQQCVISVPKDYVHGINNFSNII